MTGFEKYRGSLVWDFELQFSIFKQHYTYFYTFYLHVFSKNINITRTTLLNGPIVIVKFDREICFKNEKDMFTTFSQQFIGD